MSNVFIAFFAYFIDKFFGEFTFIKHPIIYFGDLISFFEKHFYKNTILRGFFLVLSILSVVSFISIFINILLNLMPSFMMIIISSIIASIFIAHRMLYDSVYDILYSCNKKEAISMLVSRDTKDMNESDIYKAAIETYAENLSDGVVAPIFYLLIFGLPGIIIYKAINTMDSMVGYRDDKYENYGKVAALIDDIANYIPSRITAILIMLVSKQKNIFAFYKDGSKHDSPNAGHPITAMALAIGVKLGGNTYYYGKLKHKAHFGNAKEIITRNDVKKALKLGSINNKAL